MRTQLGRDLQPEPGDILLLQIKGVVGALVWAMQAINRDLSKWTHVGIVLEDGTLFEAQPGGAVVTPLREYADRPMALVTKKQLSKTYGSSDIHELQPLELNWGERIRITELARSYVGCGYNWTTYFYLAAYRFYIRPKWLKKRVMNSEKMICSQAADHIYAASGVHLFNDGRMPYDVTPGDLARLA